MAYVIKTTYIELAGVDVSRLCRSVSVELTAEDVDVTAMGAGGRTHLAGLRDDKITIEAYSDFTASTGLDALLSGPFYAAGTVTCWTFPTSSTVSSSNPRYGGTFQLLTYNPISGAVGDASMTPIELVPFSGTISRATS